MRPRLVTARGHLLIAGKLALALIAAWIGGSIVFWILASGTWLYGLSAAILPASWFDWWILALVWLCRVGVFGALLGGWVFPRARKRRTFSP